jgi:hypothetical protein
MTQPQPDIHEAANQAAQIIHEARTRLDALLVAACPGPHLFVVHKDKNPPWCDACRYTADGVRIGAPRP